MDELNGRVSERIEVAARALATLVEVLEQPAGAIVRDAAILRFTPTTKRLPHESLRRFPAIARCYSPG
jgi:hypothetical protein